MTERSTPSVDPPRGVSAEVDDAMVPTSDAAANQGASTAPPGIIAGIRYNPTGFVAIMVAALVFCVAGGVMIYVASTRGSEAGTPMMLGALQLCAGLVLPLFQPWRRKRQQGYVEQLRGRVIGFGWGAVMAGVMGLMLLTMVIDAWTTPPMRFVLPPGQQNNPQAKQWLANYQREQEISRWVGTLAAPLLLIGAGVLGWLAYRANQKLGRARGQCRECGYDLRGLTEHRCPECGKPFDPADLLPKPPKRVLPGCDACGRPWRMGDGAFCPQCGVPYRMKLLARDRAASDTEE